MKNTIKIIVFTTVIIFLTFNKINAQWIQTRAPLSGNITYLAASNNGIFAGTLSTVYFTGNDGSNWEQRSVGIPTSEIYSLVVDSEWVNETRIFACTDNGVYLSTNNGISWESRNEGLSNLYVHCLAVNDSDVFAGTYGDGIFYSKNNGSSWIPLKSNLPKNLFVSSIAVFPNKLGNKNLIAGTNNGVFLSKDYGTSWTQINNGLDTNYVINTIITNPDVLGDSDIFLGTKGQGIDFTSDCGSNWFQTNAGLPSDYIYSLVAVSQNQSTINLFAGVYYYGVYLSTDNGANWYQINDELPTDNYLTSLAIKDGYILAAINGTSIWKRPLSELITDIKDRNKNLPKIFRLEQNYPNPFNPTTTIKYSIPKVEDANYRSFTNVQLNVYDILGREIATLVNEKKPAGNYEVNFNAAKFPTGVYFYRISVGEFVKTKKMLLLK